MTRIALIGGMLLLAGRLAAAPPRDPLPVPLFTLDPQSPEIGMGIFSADDILRVTGSGTGTAIEVPGAALGLGQQGDVLDAISANEVIPQDVTFVLRFSVDRQTVGGVMPDPLLASQDVPYNVADQAARGHAAGDLYMSTALFNRTGPTNGTQLTLTGPGANNTPVDNQYDEGGNDFNTVPQTSAEEITSGEQGNVNGTKKPIASPLTGFAGVPVDPVYFSAGAGSPSLTSLPGGAARSGARIFFNANPTHPGFTTVQYAAPSQLGLQLADDIDALVVFDQNFNGAYDGQDQVLFSLTPDSPSLKVLPNGEVGGGAYVLSATFGSPPTIFADPLMLGLAMPQDNIDALELDLCDDPITCALARGIRRLKGDCDNDGDFELDDFACFYECLAGPDVSTDQNGPNTHFVEMVGFNFNPNLNIIERGDTVTWVWVSGLHNVISGLNGVPNGIFSSGAPTDVFGTMYSVTFDAPFLSLHPVPANVYHYFCEVHVAFGMVGRVAVRQPPCQKFDFMNDNDVDLRDFRRFQNTFAK